MYNLATLNWVDLLKPKHILDPNYHKLEIKGNAVQYLLKSYFEDIGLNAEISRMYEAVDKMEKRRSWTQGNLHFNIKYPKY